MPVWTKVRLLWGFLCIVALSYAAQPHADLVAVIIVAAIAPAATLFALIYGFTVPWWETDIGRAMLISSTGLALLVDISLAYQMFGDNYAFRDVVRLTVFAIVCAGAWYKLWALLRGKIQARRARRAHRVS